MDIVDENVAKSLVTKSSLGMRPDQREEMPLGCILDTKRTEVMEKFNRLYTLPSLVLGNEHSREVSLG